MTDRNARTAGYVCPHRRSDAESPCDGEGGRL